MSKNDFNATINLPKTDFPMRAGLAKREPRCSSAGTTWTCTTKCSKKNDGKPRFSLHDGPPFSNGDIHMGHALNKALKDFIVRSYAMRGYYTPYIPGWDNHGMPIESAIIKEQKLNHKAMSVADFRSACHDYAQKYIDRQMAGFKRMGVMGDWEHPYKTMNKGFEADEVRVFGKMYQNGHIYKGLKPVYWCPHDETALAEAEIEYQDDPCTTVYVKFPMHDDLGKLPNVDHSKLFFVIWTTTIWTLPGNLAIALNPRELYNLVQAPNGEVYIMADALTEKVMHIGGFDSYEVLEQHPGNFFENMLADHPFLPKTSRLVLADYVTMDSGTGCVHTAPGFGADDYLTCKRYGMDMVVPVDDQGPSHRLRRQVRRHVHGGIEPRHPRRHEGSRFPVRQRGHRAQLPALLALQTADHLPRHAAVVLLRRFVQGGGRRRVRERALAPELGQGAHGRHDPRARRLVHLPPAPLGPADPGILLR